MFIRMAVHKNEEIILPGPEPPRLTSQSDSPNFTSFAVRATAHEMTPAPIGMTSLVPIQRFVRGMTSVFMKV